MTLKKSFKFLFLGLLLGISQSFLFCIPLIIFVYYSFLKNVYKMTSYKYGFFYSWLFGTGFFLGSMHWMISPFLVYEKHFYLIPIGALIFPILMGVFFIFPVCLIIFFEKNHLFMKNKIFLRSLVVCLFFLFSEILRSKLFGGLPLNLTGHIWAFNSEFIQIVKFFGIFGLSFLTILWIILSANLLIHLRLKTFIVSIFSFPLILISFNLINFEYKEIDDEKAFVRVVQPNIPQKEKWNKVFFEKNFEKMIALTIDGNQEEVTKIVVWPEVALTFYLNEERDFLNYLQKKIPENIILITGSLRRTIEDGSVKIFNSLYVIKDDKLVFYDKKKLVPFGEFIPFRSFSDFLKLTPGSTDFSVGEQSNQIEVELEYKKIIFEPSICYEAIFQTFSNEESQFIINITNDAWFGKTTGPRQHLSAQIFRAVEKSIPLIRSANSGISVITNQNGKIIKSINLNKSGFVELNLPLKKTQTFFESYRNYSNLILIFFVFLLFYLIDIFYQLKVNVKPKKLI